MTLLVVIPGIFREAVSTNPVLVVGEFSNMRFTAEHAYGYSVQLWRQGDKWFGLLNASEGLIGDTPTGFLDNVRFEGRTSRLSFTAKLTTGATLLGSSPPFKEVTVCERFEFRGVLGATTLVGMLTRDRLQPTKVHEGTEAVRLRKVHVGPMIRPANYTEWKNWADGILKVRSPKC